MKKNSVIENSQNNFSRLKQMKNALSYCANNDINCKLYCNGKLSHIISSPISKIEELLVEVNQNMRRHFVSFFPYNFFDFQIIVFDPLVSSFDQSSTVSQCLRIFFDRSMRSTQSSSECDNTYQGHVDVRIQRIFHARWQCSYFHCLLIIKGHR